MLLPNKLFNQLLQINRFINNYIKSKTLITDRFKMKSKKQMKTKKKPKSKSQSKRLKTFNSSDFSFADDKHQLSLFEPNQLFKNQFLRSRRNHVHSALSNYQTIYKSSTINLNKSTSNILKKRKKTTSSRAQKTKTKKEEPYETIKYQENSSNGEIMFSHVDTKRTNSICQEFSKQDYEMQIPHFYTVDANKTLKISIKRQYHRRADAAIKIQKVFRGYMTRKILAKYLNDIESEIIQLKKRSVNIIDEQQRSFSLEQITPQEGIERTFKEVFPRLRINLEIEKFNHANRPRIKFNELQESQGQNLLVSEKQEEEEQSEDSFPIRYRHKQPIYSQEGIVKFLNESSEDSEEVDHFQPDIIFQTNQEYLESRKSSIQNKNEPANKLSKPNIKQQLVINQQRQTNREGREVQKEQLQKNLLSITAKEVQEISYKKTENKLKQTQNNKGIFQQFKEKEVSQKSSFYEDVLKLKQEEKQRWNEVIFMVNDQLEKNKDSKSQSTVSVMKRLLQMSQKNKQFLDSTQSINLEGTSQITVPTFLSKNSDMDQNLCSIQNQNRIFKKKKLKIDIYDTKYPEQEGDTLLCEIKKKKSEKEEQFNQFFSNEQDVSFKTCPIPRKQNLNIELEKKNRQRETFSPLFKNKGKIKQFIASNLQDDAFHDMLRIRQELLGKRQSQELLILNNQLGNRLLSQQQFLNKLESLTKKFKKQKEAIDKVKQDIQRGQKAAMNLIKESFFDAKRLGFKLSMCRSQDNIKYKNQNFLMNEIIVDEITPKSTKKSFKDIFLEEEDKSNYEKSANQNSSVDFTEEELQGFRKLHSHELEINQLNRNILISEDFCRKQKNEGQFSSQQPQRQVYHFEEEFDECKDQNNDLYQIIDKQIQMLMWEAAAEIATRPNLAEKFIDRTKSMKPPQINEIQRHRFLELLQKNLPHQDYLHNKLNQKITPLPSEILKCMRLDFSEEDQQEEAYEQISKYQFIISQDICIQTVLQFKKEIMEELSLDKKDIQQEKNKEYILEMLGNGEKAQMLKKNLLQRQKFIQRRKQHSKDLHWEVMNIEIHCIFDAWNQQIIQLRSEKSGFSGIGLNELTLSLIDHNKQVQKNKVQNIVNQAKDAVKETIDPQTEVNTKILKQNFKQICQNDSAWIFYADQALSYGLQIVYLIEEQLYKETEKELQKIILKKQFT